MTTITLPRATVEQALEALTPWMDSDHTVQHAAYHALRAAMAQQAEPAQDQDVEDAIEAAYWQFDCRKKGLNEWASAPQTERDAFKAEARKLVRGYFPTRQAQDTKREMLAVADAFIRGKRAALAQQAEPVEPVATVTECEACFTPDVCQLRGTCDYYTASQMRIAALAQQAEPVAWEGWWLHHGQHNYRAKPLTSERVKELMKLAFEVGREAAPPHRKPLTEEEAAKACGASGNLGPLMQIVRAVERAHGIKE